MNIKELVNRYEGAHNIQIGSDMEYCMLQGCPHLQCAARRNPKRAVYHKVANISFADNTVRVRISPFYEEDRALTLRDLLMATDINDVQIGDGIRLVGGRPIILEFIRSDIDTIYRDVKSFKIIDGVMMVNLTPSIEDIMQMFT